MTISIGLYDENNRFLYSVYSTNMNNAIKSATKDAQSLVRAGETRIYCRDCLGGLRAEIWRSDNDGQVKVRKT